MVINRASGLVLPASTKTLIDKVMYGHQLRLLPWIVGIVGFATLIQGITSYTLTQLLSKEGQRLIAELRMRSSPTSAACPSPSTTKTVPAPSSPAS